MLGAGALTTAGVIMREELAEIAQRVLTEAMGATKNISLGKLLDFVGLQRRRSFLSTSLGGAGMLAAGVLSGAALIYWLAPARGEIPVRKSSLEMDGAQHHNSVSSSTDAFHAPV